jgi:hypothetical protein
MLCNPADVQVMIDKVVALIEQRQQAAMSGILESRHIVEKYAWKKMAARLEGFYLIALYEKENR